MIIKETGRYGILRWLRFKLFQKRLLLFLIPLIFLAIAAYLFAEWRFGPRLEGQGYKSVGEFAIAVSRNYLKGLTASAPDMVLDIKHKHFQKLAWRRQRALDRGVIVNEDDSWVPATIRYKGQTLEAEIRLKGHMTDHIQGEKWSYRVKLEGPGHVEGMRRFTLQHPGTRGYINEWIYHQIQKRQGVIALRYKFIDLTQNGKDLGIYALEENFDQELVQNNNRPEGPLMRFDPNLYWVYRLRMMDGLPGEHEFARFSSAVLEPYRMKKSLEDPSLRKAFGEAQKLMEGFRSGTLSPAEVFDLQKMADFHAVIDLMGGHHSLDWSDVKFYYNTITRLIEPVAYESFAIFETRSLAGSYRFKVADVQRMTYHEKLFSDPTFFSIYVKSLEKISQTAYLDNFFESVSDSLDHNLSILYREFPYKKFRKEMYYKNQERIRALLEPTSALRVFYDYERPELTMANISALPVRIEKIVAGKLEYELTDTILPSKQPNAPMSFVRLPMIIPGADTLWEQLHVVYRIPGSSKTKTAEVRLHRWVEPAPILITSKQLLSTLDFIKRDSVNQTLTILPGIRKVTGQYEVESGWTLQIIPGTLLQLDSGSAIIANGPVQFMGEPENFSEIHMAADAAIHLRDTTSRSTFSYMHIIGGGGDQQQSSISVYNGDIHINDCLFSGSQGENALGVFNSTFTFKQVSFDSIANDAIDLKFSSGKGDQLWFNNIKEDGVDASFSQFTFTSVRFRNIGNRAFNIKTNSVGTLATVDIEDVAEAVSAEDGSVLNITNLRISRAKVGFSAKANKEQYFGGKVNVTGFKGDQIEKLQKVDDGGEVILDQKAAGN